ncbi:unnamed protein product [Albugo candida]|uniref:Uncharacterized protein n=1 Tax=Albugo candida TaxID=65357 RepID=A0A024FY38_9STRA|nr:unnamed protein product [Albugo candida]|eukprot:CCI11569.1 unnamed protein product [Albugo candida]
MSTGFTVIFADAFLKALVPTRDSVYFGQAFMILVRSFMKLRQLQDGIKFYGLVLLKSVAKNQLMPTMKKQPRQCTCTKEISPINMKRTHSMYFMVKDNVKIERK